MSNSLNVEVSDSPILDNASHLWQIEAVGGGEYYTVFPVNESVTGFAHRIMTNLPDNGGFNYVTFAGDSALRRLASAGPLLFFLAARIVDAHHSPLVRIFGRGNEEQIRIIKTGFSGPWTVQFPEIGNNKEVIPHHARHRRRIERITGNHSNRIERITSYR